MAFKWFVVSLLIFTVGSFVFFCINQLLYHSSLRLLRKALYTLFIVAISIGLLIDEIQLSNWPFLLTLTSIIIFIDLSLLLTPSILKIWKAEFQHEDYVENLITSNNKAIKGTLNRAVTMSTMIQNASHHFLELFGKSSEANSELLKRYLEEYANVYGLDVQIFSIDYAPVALDSIPSQDKENLNEQEITKLAEDLGFMEGIKTILRRIEELNTFEFGKEFDSYADSLYNMIIVALEEDSMLIPILMEERNMLIVLKNREGELLEVDGIHITNLVYLFYSYA